MVPNHTNQDWAHRRDGRTTFQQSTTPGVLQYKRGSQMAPVYWKTPPDVDEGWRVGTNRDKGPPKANIRDYPQDQDLLLIDSSLPHVEVFTRGDTAVDRVRTHSGRHVYGRSATLRVPGPYRESSGALGTALGSRQGVSCGPVTRTETKTLLMGRHRRSFVEKQKDFECRKRGLEDRRRKETPVFLSKGVAGKRDRCPDSRTYRRRQEGEDLIR